MPDKYIVLDRDGVINVDLFDYVLKNETFEFEKGSIEALIKLSKNIKLEEITQILRGKSKWIKH